MLSYFGVDNTCLLNFSIFRLIWKLGWILQKHPIRVLIVIFVNNISFPYCLGKRWMHHAWEWNSHLCELKKKRKKIYLMAAKPETICIRSKMIIFYHYDKTSIEFLCRRNQWWLHIQNKLLGKGNIYIV